MEVKFNFKRGPRAHTPLWLSYYVEGKIYVEGKSIGEICFWIVDLKAIVRKGFLEGFVRQQEEICTSYFDTVFTNRGRFKAQAVRALGKTQPAKVAIGAGTRLNPKYRGKGYGLEAMRIFIETFDADLFLIRPSSISKPSDPEAKVKLRKHWGKLGYRQVGSSSIWGLTKQHYGKHQRTSRKKHS
jgi:hypothetical protein